MGSQAQLCKATLQFCQGNTCCTISTGGHCTRDACGGAPRQGNSRPPTTSVMLPSCKWCLDQRPKPASFNRVRCPAWMRWLRETQLRFEAVSCSPDHGANVYCLFFPTPMRSQAVASAAPRGLYICGNTSTSAGMTVAVIKDPITGDFSFEVMATREAGPALSWLTAMGTAVQLLARGWDWLERLVLSLYQRPMGQPVGLAASRFSVVQAVWRSGALSIMRHALPRTGSNRVQSWTRSYLPCIAPYQQQPCAVLD
jgi:hypothetical protein